MARVPSTSSLINVVLGCYPTLRELEMLDMSRTIFGDAKNKEYVYSALRNCALEVLAIRVAGGNRRAGVLDDLPEVCYLSLMFGAIIPMGLALWYFSGDSRDTTALPRRRPNKSRLL
jgi:hypothetical protein